MAYAYDSATSISATLPAAARWIPGEGWHLDVLECFPAFRLGPPIEMALEINLTPADQDSPLPPMPRVAILLVDDDHSFASGLARLLRRDGHTVEVVANGRLALAKLQERLYDLILSDLRMPELDGPGLYRVLVQHYPHLCRRCIFLTGDALSSATLMFLEQSGVPQLTKPFTAAAVRRAIQQVLGGGA